MVSRVCCPLRLRLRTGTRSSFPSRGHGFLTDSRAGFEHEEFGSSGFFAVVGGREQAQHTAV